MKIARFFGAIFGILGILVMLGSVVICFASLNSSVKILEYPQEAAECSDAFQEALCAGDYAALEKLLYGAPQLGGTGTPADPITAKLWEACRSRISFSYTGSLYLLDSQLARDGKLSMPDTRQLLEDLRETVPALLSQKALGAEDPAALQTADGAYRPEIVDQAIQEALDRLLSEELPLKTQPVTLQLVFRQDRWWVLPEDGFLAAISGPAA